MPKADRVPKVDADRIYVDQVERLKKVASDRNVSKAELHRWCLDFALEHVESGNAPQPEPDKAA